MPITLKPNAVKYKDPVTGNYVNVDVMGEKITYDAEAYAKGTRNGIAVSSTEPGYQDNSKYYAEQAQEILNSIPEDYSSLVSDVSDLKDDLTNIESSYKDNIYVLSKALLGAWNPNTWSWYTNIARVCLTFSTTKKTIVHLIDPSSYDMYFYVRNAQGVVTESGWTDEDKIINENCDVAIMVRNTSVSDLTNYISEIKESIDIYTESSIPVHVANLRNDIDTLYYIQHSAVIGAWNPDAWFKTTSIYRVSVPFYTIKEATVVLKDTSYDMYGYIRDANGSVTQISWTKGAIDVPANSDVCIVVRNNRYNDLQKLVDYINSIICVYSKQSVAQRIDVISNAPKLGCCLWLSTQNNYENYVKPAMLHCYNIGMRDAQIVSTITVDATALTATPDSTDVLMQCIDDIKEIGYTSSILKIHFYTINGTLSTDMPDENMLTIINAIESALVNYAQICQNNGINALFITNEADFMTNNSSFVSKWASITSNVRAVYEGYVGHAMTNKQSMGFLLYNQEDTIGVNLYPQLCFNPDGDILDCGKSKDLAWSGKLYDKLHNQYRNKPFYITEIGCPARKGALASPGYIGYATAIDEDVQEICYTIILNYIKTLKFVNVVYIFEVSSTEQFIGRKAEKVVRDYLAEVK